MAGTNPCNLRNFSKVLRYRKGLILVCNGLVQGFSCYGTPTTVYWYAALIKIQNIKKE
jgi:hypothetical protein